MLQLNRKLAPKVRNFWGALLLAVLVHLLLLILFRASPMQSEMAQDGLPKVGRIELDDPANKAFAQWLKNHDPALLLAPGKNNNFGSVMQQTFQRNAVEDLPSLPHLSAPRRQEAARSAVARFKSAANTLLPEETSYLQSRRSAGKTAVTPVVYIDHRELAEAEKLVAVPAKLIAAMPAAGRSKLQNTLIAVAPPRLKGMEARLNLTQSSGNDALDKAALQSAAAYLADQTGCNLYQIEFNWQNLPVSDDKEQKK